MTPEKITIYQDNDIRVEIDRFCHEILNNNRPHFFKLKEEELEFVLKQVLFRIDLHDLKNHNITEDKKRQFIGNIPIIVSGRPFGLMPPYDIFNTILFYLSLNSTLDGASQQIANDINVKFGPKGFFCCIFPHSIFDVKGFLVYTQNEKEIILLFSFKDDIQNLDFLDKK